MSRSNGEFCKDAPDVSYTGGIEGIDRQEPDCMNREALLRLLTFLHEGRPRPWPLILGARSKRVVIVQ